MLFKLAILIILMILFCLFLRWVAKGVAQGRKPRLAMAGFFSMASGCYHIFAFANGIQSPVSTLLVGRSSVSTLLVGIFGTISAMFLFFLTISPGQADSHET